MLTELRKRIVIRMLTEIGKFRENFNKKLENIKKKPSELNNAITEMRNTLEDFFLLHSKGNHQQNKKTKQKDSRQVDTEECIIDLEDKLMEITQSEEQKKSKFLKMRKI